MPGQHKTNPKAVRMPGGLLAWYEEHAEATGQKVNGAIVTALEDYRARNGGSTAPGPAEEVVAPRKRDTGIRQRPARTSRDAEPEHSPALGDEEPEPATARKRAAKGPCEHRVKPGAWCKTCERLI